MSAPVPARSHHTTRQHGPRWLTEDERELLDLDTPSRHMLRAADDTTLHDGAADAHRAGRDLDDAGHQPPHSGRALHALLELAYSGALTERLHARTWDVACTALRHDADPRTVARALNITVDQLRHGLHAWIQRQREAGAVGAGELIEILALVRGPGGPDR